MPAKATKTTKARRKPRKTIDGKMTERSEDAKRIGTRRYKFAPEIVRKPGRPSIFSEQMAEEICARIASGETLTRICRPANMPKLYTIQQWLHKREPRFIEFAAMYARARELQAEVLADQLLDIVDGAVDANLARVRMDARKWLASKLLPKRFGDKLAVEADISITTKIEERLARAAQRLNRFNKAEAIDVEAKEV